MATTISEQEQELVKHLRQEGYNVKQCFTQYTFQGLAVTAAVLGVILNSKENFPYVGLVGVPLAILLITIARIGTHKYESANRLAGYELHLQRVARYPCSPIQGWHPTMRTMGWEEGMRAWRIVQGTVFSFLYVHGNLRSASPQQSVFQEFWSWAKNLVFFWKVDHRRTHLIRSDGTQIPQNEEWWFETRSHLRTGMAYHAGGYMQTLLHLLGLTALICVGFAIAASWQLYSRSCERTDIAYFVVVLGFSYWTFARFFQARSRRKLLEEGLLSINSCAVLWQVITCAHFWTLHELSERTQNKFTSYENYSRTLGEKAVRFCDKIDRIYEWYEAVPIGAMVSRENSVLGDATGPSRWRCRLVSVFRRGACT
jgi:hypothetical protein